MIKSAGTPDEWCLLQCCHLFTSHTAWMWRLHLQNNLQL